MDIKEAVDIIDAYEQKIGECVVGIYAVDELHTEPDGTLEDCLIETATYIRSKIRGRVS